MKKKSEISDQKIVVWVLSRSLLLDFLTGIKNAGRKNFGPTICFPSRIIRTRAGYNRWQILRSWYVSSWIDHLILIKLVETLCHVKN